MEAPTELQPTDEQPAVEIKVQDKAAAEPEVRPVIIVRFAAVDSAAFELQRTPGISPWMLIAAAEHMREQALIELRAFLMSEAQRREQERIKAEAEAEARERKARKRPFLPVPRNPIGGHWKPPALRKG